MDSGFEVVWHYSMEINFELLARSVVILRDFNKLAPIVVVQRGSHPAELLNDVIVDRHNLFKHMKRQRLPVFLCLHDEVACLIL